MAERARRRTLGRAAIAVLSLYALLMQPFLAAAAPAVLDAAGMLCTHEPGGSKAPGADKAHACCPVLCLAGPAALPSPGSVAVAAHPVRRVVRIAWNPRSAHAARAPPAVSATARGPPVV